MKISARNVISGSVAEIREGVVTAHVKVDIGGQLITSSITMDSVRELGLAVGKSVYVVVKASDVMLGVEHHER